MRKRNLGYAIIILALVVGVAWYSGIFSIGTIRSCTQCGETGWGALFSSCENSGSVACNPIYEGQTCKIISYNADGRIKETITTGGVFICEDSNVYSDAWYKRELYLMKCNECVPTTTTTTTIPPNCPEGQELKTIRDCETCGSEVELTNLGTFGSCVNFCCPEKLGLADVDHCNVGTTTEELDINSPNYDDKIAMYATETLLPNECKSWPDKCEETLNYINTGQGQYWYAVYQMYRVSCLYCDICVDQPCIDECELGDMRCGQGSTIEVCGPPTSENPCLHWEFYYNCLDNKICHDDGEQLHCIKTCSSDSDCESNQYCGYGSLITSQYCQPKKNNGESCSRNGECKSDLCENGKCKAIHQDCIETGDWGCGFVLGQECCDANARCEGIPILKMIIGGTCLGGGNVLCDKNLAMVDKDICLACGGIWYESGIFTGIWNFLFGGQETVKCQLPSFLILQDIFLYAIIFIIIVMVGLIAIKLVGRK